MGQIWEEVGRNDDRRGSFRLFFVALGDVGKSLVRFWEQSPLPNSSRFFNFGVDCLTMFCTSETKAVPGAVHGGRAIPDRRYFDSDELHLNNLGYDIWKEILDEKIQSIMHAA